MEHEVSHDATKTEIVSKDLEAFIDQTDEIQIGSEANLEHYSVWIERYDQLDDPESSLRSAVVCLTLNHALSLLREAAKNLRQARDVIREGEML